MEILPLTLAITLASTCQSEASKARWPSISSSTISDILYPKFKMKTVNVIMFGCCKSDFLAVHNSSIGDLVTHSLRVLLHLTLQSDPGDS